MIVHLKPSVATQTLCHRPLLCTDQWNGTNLCKTTTIITRSSSRQQKKQKQTVKWVACSSTIVVTQAIDMYVMTNDVVAELGSQLQELSVAMCE